VLVALAPLHGLTFGAFYVASVAFLSRRVPPELRASGQALFSAVTFGLGGLVGYASSGAAYDWLGGHRLFAVAAVLELVAAVLVLQAASPPEPDAVPGGTS
jgi:PPP family 3-phenylpropionic acid transporter